MVYGEDENQWENMHEQFPQRIRSSLGGKEKILKVDTSPMWNEEGLLDSLLFVIEDITELELLAEKVKAEKDKGNRKLLIMQEMMSCASEDAEDFFAKVDEFIQQINAVFRKTSWEKEDINLIFRNLHTIKGNARSYNLSFLSATTHKVETSFVEIQDIHFDLPFFEKKSMPILVEQVNEYREVMNKIYHSEQDGVTLPSKSKKQIKALRSFMRENEGKLPSDVFSVLNNMMNQILDESCLNPIKKLVEKTVKVTSADCGKNVDFDVQGIDFIVPDMVLSLIKDSIVHIIRNAIGHGIETKDIRKLSGKDLIGHIIVNVVPTEDQLKVQIADDGRGIDTNRLKKKAIDLKFMKAADAEKATKEQLIELLFMPGFSTKDQVTETSGRGVGLDVARENIEKAGGLLKVETILNVGTTFTLILPLKGGIELIAPIAA
jgi:chemotaxis protein histidine kinase CheA